MKDKIKICIWPDGSWAYREDMEKEDYSWKGDDYASREVYICCTDEEIDLFAYLTASNKIR